MDFFFGSVWVVSKRSEKRLSINRGKDKELAFFPLSILSILDDMVLLQQMKAMSSSHRISARAFAMCGSVSSVIQGNGDESQCETVVSVVAMLGAGSPGGFLETLTSVTARVLLTDGKYLLV